MITFLVPHATYAQPTVLLSGPDYGLPLISARAVRDASVYTSRERHSCVSHACIKQLRHEEVDIERLFLQYASDHTLL
jgi:hypothetical protein